MKYAPMIQSMLDDDWYKFTMGQIIYRKHRDVRVNFGFINRTKEVKLGNVLDIKELRAQLDYVRSLRFSDDDLSYIEGKGIKNADYLEYLRKLSLGVYNLSTYEGDLCLEFEDTWPAASPWEVKSLAVVSELRAKCVAEKENIDTKFVEAQAQEQLKLKLRKLATLPKLALSEFGTRRRYSYAYQKQAINQAIAFLADSFTGTSNVHIAMEQGLEPRGTIAHEMSMVYAALAETDEQIKQAQYDVIEDYAEEYEKGRVFLPDTFGTTQFLKNAPDVLETFVAGRVDSKAAQKGVDEFCDWWKQHNIEPKTRTTILADGMDVQLDGHANGEDMYKLVLDNINKTNLSFGWGTNMTNGFKGLAEGKLDPLSIVVKVKTANGKPAVKLSDQIGKATGNAKEIKRYYTVFGKEGMTNRGVPKV